MAIYHLSAYIVSGNRGSSAVAAAAYQSGDTLYSGLDGLEKDYNRKERVVFKDIMLPQFAPERLKNREVLWNEIESIDGTKGQYARRFTVALPRELTLEQNIVAVKDLVQTSFTGRGMVADVAIHYDDRNNPHAHIMCTMRPLLVNGRFGKKDASVVIKKRGKDGKMHPIPVGRDKRGRLRYKRERQKTTDWDRVETLKAIRQEWQDVCNAVLECAGSNARIDYRSHKDRAREDGTPEMLPTRHLGPAASAMEARGQRTEVGNYNRTVKVYNVQLIADSSEKELAQIESEREEAQRQLQDISDARMQITAAQGLLASLTAERDAWKKKKFSLEMALGEWDNPKTGDREYGELHEMNRPSGFFKGKEKRAFDNRRNAALKEYREIKTQEKDGWENKMDRKITEAGKALSQAKNNLRWINPEVKPQRAATAAKGKTQQRTAATTPHTKERRKGRADGGAGLALGHGDDDKGMHKNRALLTEAAKEEEINQHFWRGI